MSDLDLQKRLATFRSVLERQRRIDSNGPGHFSQGSAEGLSYAVDVFDIHFGEDLKD